MNISIKHNNNHVKINDLGFITHCSSNPLINESHPIYLVLFEEYSRLNPFCHPWDMSEDIQLKSWSEDRLIYTKKINDFIFEHSISVTDKGIDWAIHLDTNCTNHSVGLALPYYKDWLDFSQEPIKEDIANYSNFFHRGLFPDQHILDIPCILTDKSAVFGNMKNTYQFFRYRDGDSRWLRMTTSTTTPTEDAVEFCIRTDATDIRKLYLEKFPEAGDFIYKWKSQFKELGERYGINIIYQQSETTLNKGNVTYVSKLCPTEKDLEKFYPILKKELEKYPVSLFDDLDITCIQLVVDLWIQTDRITQNIDERRQPGYSASGILWTDGGRGIIIDMQAPVSVIHHEIFHGLQQKTKFDNMPGEISQFSDSAQITDTNEFLAELFALLMTDPGKAYSPQKGIDLAQIDYLKEGVKEFLNFPDLPSGSENRTIFAITSTGVEEIQFGKICAEATHYSFKGDQ